MSAYLPYQNSQPICATCQRPMSQVHLWKCHSCHHLFCDRCMGPHHQMRLCVGAEHAHNASYGPPPAYDQQQARYGASARSPYPPQQMAPCFPQPTMSYTPQPSTPVSPPLTTPYYTPPLTSLPATSSASYFPPSYPGSYATPQQLPSSTSVPVMQILPPRPPHDEQQHPSQVKLRTQAKDAVKALAKSKNTRRVVKWSLVAGGLVLGADIGADMVDGLFDGGGGGGETIAFGAGMEGGAGDSQMLGSSQVPDASVGGGSAALPAAYDWASLQNVSSMNATM